MTNSTQTIKMQVTKVLAYMKNNWIQLWIILRLFCAITEVSPGVANHIACDQIKIYIS